MERINVQPGDTLWLTMPYSEVCMSMRVAGRRMCVEIKSDGVQLIDNGHNFSFPILFGEAGIYRDADGSLYTYR